MAMQTDVKASSMALSGTVFDGRTRVRGMLIEPGATDGSVVLKNGGTGGTTVMTINTIGGKDPFPVIIPGEGVLFEINVYIALTNTKATVFYG